MAFAPNYPSPIYIVNGATGTGLQSNILDVGSFMTPGYPPVIQVSITGGAATVQILASTAITAGPPPALVRGTDITNGGLVASDFVDGIPGVQFYQVNIVSNSGVVDVFCGRGPSTPGATGEPQILQMTTNATQGL